MATYQRIEVTQRDIDKADPKASGKCAIATAIARTFPDARNVTVDLQTVRYTIHGERHVYLTPPVASGYVVAFDRGDQIHPFQFRLNDANRLPVQVQKRTDAGRAIDRAKTNVRHSKAQAQKLKATTASPTEQRKARKKVVQAEATLKAVEQVHASQKKTFSPTPGLQRPPAIAWKTSRREYGGRVLRINQDRADTSALTTGYDAQA